MEIEEILAGKILAREGFTFDDLLLLPSYTDFKRGQVDLTTRLHPRLVLKLPLLAAPMDTVCEDKMAIALARRGALGVIHRNLSVEKQAAIAAAVKNSPVADVKTAALDEKQRLLCAAAVGGGEDLPHRIEALVNAAVDLVVVDSGHGHSKLVIDAVAYIKKHYPRLPAAAGNVATFEGASALIEAGCDILRVGMGPGSICTTRVVTGMGVPQITAVAEAVRAGAGKPVTVVADGGIRQIGDCAKALAFGAAAVMLGSLLARFDEAPGAVVTVEGKKYKQYRGMGSVAAMKRGGAERYCQSKAIPADKLIAEGVEGLVSYQGRVGDYLMQFEGSLRSSFYYVGARTLPEFFRKARAVRISQASLSENHPHSVIVQDAGANYML